jgi:hypothetical protein
LNSSPHDPALEPHPPFLLHGLQCAVLAGWAQLFGSRGHPIIEVGDIEGEAEGLLVGEVAAVGTAVLLTAVSHPSSQSAWPSAQQL